MAALANVNGHIADEQHAVISVFDHGFLYGEGVYETLRTYNRRPFLFDRHMKRLRTSARMIALRIPFPDEEFRRRAVDTIAAADKMDEAYIRILVTRGPGDLTYDPAACPTPSVVVIVKPHVEPPAELFTGGVKIALVSIIRNHPASVNPLIKSNNLLNNALAMQEALTRGAEEALMKNYRGELAECSQSNFFLVKNGEVLTPPLDAGLLAGVTRDFLFEIGAQIGVPIREAVLREDDLDTADEVFITSTSRELMGVSRVDDRMIGTGRPGPITARLLKAYRQKAQELTKHPDRF